MNFRLSVENAWFWSRRTNFQILTLSKITFLIQRFSYFPKSFFFIKNKIQMLFFLNVKFFKFWAIMKAIISGRSKFEKLDIQEGKHLNFILNKKNFRKIIKPFYEKGCFTKSKYLEKTRPQKLESKPGILYGQAKIYKPVEDNCPSFSPILSAIGTPAYKLAKLFVPILNPLSENEYTEILIISNLRHSASRVWTCAEPEFKLSWMKLCSSDNRGATYIESLFTDTERYWKSIKILKVYLLTFLCKKLLIS